MKSGHGLCDWKDSEKPRKADGSKSLVCNVLVTEDERSWGCQQENKCHSKECQNEVSNGATLESCGETETDGSSFWN